VLVVQQDSWRIAFFSPQISLQFPIIEETSEGRAVLMTGMRLIYRYFGG
jgi:hypothetical protein